MTKTLTLYLSLFLLYKMDEDFKNSPSGIVKMAYLIIYTQVDLAKCPVQVTFGVKITKCFHEDSGKCKVEYLACSLEPYKKQLTITAICYINLSHPNCLIVV